MSSSAFSLSTMSRIEEIGRITFAENTATNLSSQGGQLPMDRFMRKLIVRFRGRATNDAGGAVAVSADGAFNIFERIQVEGYHRVRKQQERFIDLRGPDLRRYNDYYSQGVTRDLPTAAMSVAGAGTNDIDVTIHVPFTPLGLPPQQERGWLLDCPNYDSLKLTVQFSDGFSLVGDGVTWTAFGGAVGSPTVVVSGEFCMSPTKFQGFIPGRVWRTFQEETGTNLTTGGTGLRLFNINRGWYIRSLLLKTGTKVAVTAGNNSFATYSDAILTNVELHRGLGNRIRRYFDFATIIDENISARGARMPNAQGGGLAASVGLGHALIDFAPKGADFELLDTRGLVAGATGDVDTFLQADVAGAASQAMVLCTEEWRHYPRQYTR